jgi:FAD/FMN-containing dehydrogenase
MANDSLVAPRTNFGGNVHLEPTHFYVPANETELLSILKRHRSESIRAVGRVHCWSGAIAAAGVLIDLRRFDEVTIHLEGPTAFAEVGAGAQIKHLLAELRKHGYTTFSQGLIKEQAIAGASATGTHGSGKHSLSHYVIAARVAHLRDREPCVTEIVAGSELQAARCSLGCLGIVTRVRIAIRPTYSVEEHFQRYATLTEVLGKEDEYPIQQFFFVPWRWDFYAQHRREVDLPASLTVPLYRLYWWLGMDRAFHWTLMALSRALPANWTKLFFRHILGWLVPQRWKVVDRSDRQLSMGHELYRHIETELFVTRAQLPAALTYVKTTLQHAAGEAVTLDQSVEGFLRDKNLDTDWNELRGQYTHHYPLCVRKVLGDDTLISMASGDEAWYAISLVSYAAVDQRQSFFAVTAFLTRTMAQLFGARPHWGKHCPIDPALVPSLYPRLGEFREIADRFDPTRQFANLWLRQTLLNSTE